MKTKRIPQLDLPVAGECFNLFSDRGIDWRRVEEERQREEQVRRERDEYVQRMQRLLSEKCPGFAGGTMPTQPGAVGEFLIEPGCVREAMDFLKRRFTVRSEIGIETTGELRVVVASRRKGVVGLATRHRFDVEQFEFELPI